MGLAQMGALTGSNKFKRPYVEEINARTPYLPMLHQQRSEEQYRDKMYGLEKQGLALESDALKEAKKRNKTARNLGYANIGLGAGLGLLNNFDSIKSGVSSMFPTGSAIDVGDALGGVSSISPGQDFGGITDSISPVWDWADAYIEPFRQAGSAAWDATSGLFDSIVGDSLDIDWTSGFDADEVIDFGW